MYRKRGEQIAKISEWGKKILVSKSDLGTFFSQRWHFVQVIRWNRGHKGWFFKNYTIINRSFSIPNIAHHLWTLAVPGGLWSNGWYYPISFSLITWFFNLCSQNNPYDQFRNNQQNSLYNINPHKFLISIFWFEL